MNDNRTSASAALEYPFEQRPAAGERKKITDGVYWLCMPLPLGLDHINLWLLRDDDGWVIVDTGLATDEIRSIWEQVLAECRREMPVTRILVTHYHPDHLGLASWLTEKLDVEVFMSLGDYLTAHAVYNAVGGYGGAALQALYRRHGLSGKPLEQMAERGNGYRRVVPELPTRYRRIVDNETLRIGGRDWRVIMGQGHAPEHASFHCAELGVLIAGDMALPTISANVSVNTIEPDGDPLRLFLESQARFLELPADTLVLPSHGRPYRGLHRRVDALCRHHEADLAKAMETCATPQSAADLLPVLFRRDLDGFHLWLAMGEAIAHLNCLMHRGTLARRQDLAGVYRFLRASAPGQADAKSVS